MNFIVKCHRNMNARKDRMRVEVGGWSSHTSAKGVEEELYLLALGQEFHQVKLERHSVYAVISGGGGDLAYKSYHITLSMQTDCDCVQETGDGGRLYLEHLWGCWEGTPALYSDTAEWGIQKWSLWSCTTDHVEKSEMEKKKEKIRKLWPCKFSAQMPEYIKVNLLNLSGVIEHNLL